MSTQKKAPSELAKKLTNPSLIKSTCLVGLVEDGWIDSDNPSIEVINPFDNNLIGHVPSLNAHHIDVAIKTAEEVQPKWAALSAQQRADILNKWADLIDKNKEDLAIIMTAEQGKPIKESRGEIEYANSFIRWFGAEGMRIYGDIIPSTNTNQRIVVLKQPVGVCAAITPWNFPAAMITRKVAPALAAGCTMIVKPATQTPLSALALGELALAAGLPKGVLQIVTGSASVIGGKLTADARVRKLSFTGSTEIGRKLMAQCAPTLKKLSLELGGNAPFIVFDDADLAKAADGLIAAKYRNAGQTCVCANRIYVHRAIKDEFLKIYTQKVQALKVGNGLDENTDIGPLINQDALKKVKQLLDDALNKGAKLHHGGNENPASALTFNPTIISNVTQEMDIASQEIFGPVTAIFDFDNEEEVIKQANDTIYGLAAYFYSNDLARAWRVSEALDYGMVGQNTGLISTAVAPFGGVKQSGFGREGSKYGIEEYVTVKYWCQDIG